MRWYWEVLGGHTHVRVFLDGANCGELCFRNDDFETIHNALSGITFIHEVHNHA